MSSIGPFSQSGGTGPYNDAAPGRPPREPSERGSEPPVDGVPREDGGPAARPFTCLPGHATEGRAIREPRVVAAMGFHGVFGGAARDHATWCNTFRVLLTDRTSGVSGKRVSEG